MSALIEPSGGDQNVELIAALLKAGAIRYTPQAVRIACATAGVSISSVKLRFKAMETDGERYRPPAPISADTSDLHDRILDLIDQLEDKDKLIARLQSELERAVGRQIKAPKIKSDDETKKHKKCAICRKLKPIDDFYVKNPRTGARHSYCDPCRQEYQRNRYLSVKKTDVLNEVGLEFVIGESDETVGLACTACGRALEVGQRVVGHASLHHVECPGGDVALLLEELKSGR